MFDLFHFSIFLPVVMAVSLVSTIIVEVLIGLLLKVRKFKNIINIVLANLLTNPLVVSISYYIELKYETYIQYIVLAVLELLVFIVEGSLYKKYLSYDKLNPYFLSFTLNLISFVIVGFLNLFMYY